MGVRKSRALRRRKTAPWETAPHFARIGTLYAYLERPYKRPHTASVSLAFQLFDSGF